MCLHGGQLQSDSHNSHRIVEILFTVDVGFVPGFHRQQVVAHALGFAPALCLTFQTVEHRQSYARAVVHQRIGRPQRWGVPVACTPDQHAKRPQAKENIW